MPDIMPVARLVPVKSLGTDGNNRKSLIMDGLAPVAATSKGPVVPACTYRRALAGTTPHRAPAALRS